VFLALFLGLLAFIIPDSEIFFLLFVAFLDLTFGNNFLNSYICPVKRVGIREMKQKHINETSEHERDYLLLSRGKTTRKYETIGTPM
jgi:hypothetical protein